ncbi:hypothetical protein [Gordonia crocea]|uniref:Lipoprotein n=1 Tax=Gordonia crocea TaxID=589162 RepID=A0A7M3STS1_9ACTN|nr:hypothetical protein [Gordonia crocea]GED96045.1 hypothetical protein nbrc107697_00840 [Gordonia crocea]GED98963.1 hypothetical protein nbrc107697_30020 [Gordonia crocea]
MRKLIVLLGAGVLALGLSACDVRPGAGPEKSTKVVTIVAVVDGKPANGFHMEPMTGDNTIDCQYATISRAATTMGVFGGCGASAQSADVCWPGKDNTLLCGVTPWDKVLIGWTITAGQLPLGAEPKAEPEPWGMELADGRKCRARVGGAWGGRSDGMVGAYSCTGSQQEVVLQGGDAATAVDRSTPIWTVQVGKLGAGAPDFGPPSRVGVRVAYFAGAQVGG